MHYILSVNHSPNQLRSCYIVKFSPNNVFCRTTLQRYILWPCVRLSVCLFVTNG